MLIGRTSLWGLLHRAERRRTAPDWKEPRLEGAVAVARIAGRNLRRLRETHRLTVEQLASRLAVAPGAVKALESGSRGTPLASLSGCWRLCIALGCSLEDVLSTGVSASKQKRAVDPDGALKVLRFFRRQSEMPQGILAFRCGWGDCDSQHGGARSVRAIEAGDQPLSLVMAWKMCAVLRLSLEDVLPTGNAAGRPTGRDGLRQ
jgi:transcriptional regulator with XRE-family HTH domain